MYLFDRYTRHCSEAVYDRCVDYIAGSHIIPEWGDLREHER